MPVTSAQILRLYDTVFDRAPDADGLAFWTRVGDAGYGLDYMAERFIAAPEFATAYGQPDSPSFVRSLYENILDRPGEAEGVSFWTRVLDEGLADRADVVVGFSESPEHVAQLADPTPPPAGPPPVTPAIGGQNLVGTDDPDALTGGAGNDTIEGLFGGDTLDGGGGDDLLVGGRVQNVVQPDDDVLLGGEGNDTLQGATGNDALQGGPGDDVLEPGAGRDVLWGGDGADRFVFGHSTPGLPGITADPDLIRDFQQGTDVLDLTALNRVDAATDLAFTFIGDAPFSGGGAPEARAVLVGGEMVVQLDYQLGAVAAPDGQVDNVINLGTIQLTAADFLL